MCELFIKLVIGIKFENLLHKKESNDMRYFYLIFTILFYITTFINCEKDLSPLESNQTKIIPLEINNTWKFKNLSTGDLKEIKVIDKYKYNNHEIYVLNNGDFTSGLIKIFYIDDDLYGMRNDSTVTKIFIKNGPRFYSGITYSNYDSVNVPAGIFRAIKVEVSGHSGLSTFGNTKWYSFGTGPVKSESYFVNWNGEKTETIYVLESYSIN